MKNITITLLILLSGVVSLLAQSPPGFKYQALVRNSSGEILSDQPVSLRIGILQDSINGMLVYSETHNKTTNPFGLVNLHIGNGTIESGVFEDLDWGRKTYFIQVELDETGNSNYQLMGTSQLLSAPYVLNSTSLTLTSPNGATWDITLDDNGNLVTTCFPMPGPADAGPDNPFAPNPSILSGNTPSIGTGEWSIISGTGGVIENPSDPNTIFTGTIGNSYTLKWTLSTTCASNTDDVDITFGFDCPFTVTDTEGKTYNTVAIGSQCWMAENLNTGNRIDGINDQLDNSQIEKYCYNNQEINCDIYGGLYQWNEMMQYVISVPAQGICPAGWHLPVDTEWTVLTDFLGGMAVAGGKLKDTTLFWNPNNGATNESGFTALPAGHRNAIGQFWNIGQTANFYAATENGTDQAWRWYVDFEFVQAFRVSAVKTYAYSVRCIKDN
jgi:uncharacterized protein (TIGR02145 family)